jgi:hypothetical protein
MQEPKSRVGAYRLFIRRHSATMFDSLDLHSSLLSNLEFTLHPSLVLGKSCKRELVFQRVATKEYSKKKHNNFFRCTYTLAHFHSSNVSFLVFFV